MRDIIERMKDCQQLLHRPLDRESGEPTALFHTMQDAIDEIVRLRQQLNTPELDNFAAGVVSEAQHQRERWGADGDAGKGPLDWFWLIGYLAQKAATAELAGDVDKAKHHTISTAAAMANWHARLLGAHKAMRPGIAEPSG